MYQDVVFNLYMLIIFLLIVYLVITTLASRRRLKQKGIETDGYILDWTSIVLKGSGRSFTADVQSVSMPTIQFTTLDGKQIIGQPTAGVSDSPDYVHVWIRIVYNPDDPEEFMIKTWK